LGFPFTPTLTYQVLNDKEIEIVFRWKQRRKEAENSIVIDLDCFEEYRKFAETIDSSRFRHLGNAISWNVKSDCSDRLVFLIDLLLFFPFDKIIRFKQTRGKIPT